MFQNWAGNIRFGAARRHEPTSLEALQEIVRAAAGIRALGSGHSFNHIADTGADLVSVRRLNRILEIDPAKMTVRAEGGITYGELAPALHARGFALHNLASLPHITVAGACATATHGSGNGNGNLATALAGVKIVSGSGDIVALSRADRDFAGAAVSLGALGVVAEVTLDVQPAFDLQQVLFSAIPVASFEQQFDGLCSAAYSVSFFTRWQGDTIERMWLKLHAGEAMPAGIPGTQETRRQWHPISELDPGSCTQQLGVPGPWYERLPHFSMAHSPSVGAELQSEYFVPRRHALAAFRALRSVQAHFSPHLLVSEIRTIARDVLWMSPSFGEDSIAFHFTWKPDWPTVAGVLPGLEAALKPFAVKPHWGKLFTLGRGDIEGVFGQLPEFRRLVRHMDPEGKFRNEFLSTYLL